MKPFRKYLFRTYLKLVNNNNDAKEKVSLIEKKLKIQMAHNDLSLKIINANNHTNFLVGLFFRKHTKGYESEATNIAFQCSK